MQLKLFKFEKFKAKKSEKESINYEIAGGPRS